MIPYHKWLLRQRVYCEHGQCLEPATKVVNWNGKDYVYCEFHGYKPKKQPTTERQTK